MATEANWSKGNQAEQKFKNLAQELGWEIEATDLETDRQKHIDFVITWGKPMVEGFETATYTVDVKAENTFADLTWIEIRNTQGNAGWLYGEADLIAFDQGDKFLVVERVKLRDWVNENVQKEYVTHERDALMKIFSRPGKDDMLTQIQTYHLTALAIGEMKGKGYIAKNSGSLIAQNARG